MPPVSRRLLLGAPVALAAMPARAAFPERPIRLVVPFTPGGTVDLVGRLVANQVSAETGQPMVVENRGGAAGEIGSLNVVRSPADGHALLVGSTTTITIQPLVNPQLSYSPDTQLLPLCLVAYVPQVLLVNPNLPIRSVAELVALMRRESVSFGDGGPGTPHYAAGEKLRCLGGGQLIHVPYRGGGAAHADLVAGHVQAAFIELSVASPFMRSGQMRPLALAARERHAGFPEVPTLIEQGMPEFEITSWFGIFAPAGTPAPALEWLAAAILRSLANPEVREKLQTAGATVVAGNPAQLADHMRRERTKWQGLLRNAC